MEGLSPGTPAICVIMPTRHRASFALRQIEAMQRQHADARWELVIVDNGSTDSTVEMVRGISHRDARVVVVCATERCDPAYARNVGARCTRAPLLAFIDDDDVVGEGWLQA